MALSPTEFALLRFEAPDAYAIELETESVEGTVEVDDEFVDCNHSLHAVLIRDDEVDDTWTTTLEECTPAGSNDVEKEL